MTAAQLAAVRLLKSKIMPTTFKISATRQVYPWVLLWNRCRWAFEDASENEDKAYLYLFSMLLCAFTLEAFLNHVLRFRYRGDWEEFERNAKPGEKLEELSRLIDFQVDKSRRPFQTFKQIFGFRNDLVHAKPVSISKVFDYPIDKFLEADELPPMPLAEWEDLLKPNVAQRFIEDTKSMILILYEKTDLGDKPFEETYSRTKWEGKL